MAGAESKNHVMMGPGNAPLCGNVKVIHLMGVVCLCVCVLGMCSGCEKEKRKKDEYETEGAPYCPVRWVAIFRLLIPSRHIFETVSQLKVEVYKKKEHRERDIWRLEFLGFWIITPRNSTTHIADHNLAVISLTAEHITRNKVTREFLFESQS